MIDLTHRFHLLANKYKGNKKESSKIDLDEEIIEFNRFTRELV